MIYRRILSASIIFWLAAIGFIGMINFEPVSAGAPQVHSPILIEGDANFTASNGVTGGNGTEAKPYIIADWDINSTDANGIEIRNTSAYFIIQNVSVYSVNNSNKGIYLYNTSNSIIENNTIHGNYHGIYLAYSDKSRIYANNITNTSSSGISFISSTDSEILNNTIFGCYYGIYLESFSDRNNIFSNNISFNYFGIDIYRSMDNNISDNEVSYHSNGISFFYSSNCIAYNNTIIKNKNYGINIISSSKIAMIQNKISYCDTNGIRLIMTSFNNSVKSNFIFKSGIGINLEDALYNDIRYNNITSLTSQSILLSHSTGNNISYNIIDNNYYGIYLSISSDNYVGNNRISRTNGGIEIAGNSFNNDVIENNVYENRDGILLEYNSQSTKVIRNSIKFNTVSGMYFRVTSSNWILDNDITGNNIGVVHTYSNNNYFKGNNISNNEESGMLVYDSKYNIIMNNTFHNDPYYGLDLDESHSNIVNDNKFSGNDHPIRIYMSNFNGIKGNRITNSYNTIFLFHSTDNVIKYNTARNNVYGITLNDQSIGNIISYNELSNFYSNGITLNRYTESTIVSENRVENCSSGGIILSYSKLNVIYNNILDSNSNYDISLDGSTNNELSGNKMESYGIIIGGYELANWNTNTIDTSNLVNDKPVYFWTDRVGGKVPAGAGQVILANCRNVEVDGQDLSDTSTSITLVYSHNNKISNNTASSNLYDGVSLYRSDNNTIIDNIVNNNNDKGIEIYSSSNNSFKGNVVSSNEDHGISFSTGCNENDVIGNSIDSNFMAGIGFNHDSINNSISNNSISKNVVGISLVGSINTEIMNNSVSYNEYGIICSETVSNSIYHNNFIENENQTSGYNSNDLWNESYPTGGNYWSDYEGVDNKRGPVQDKFGPDGIGDTAYVSLECNDSYPLMYPFVPDKLSPPTHFQLRAGYSFISLSWWSLGNADDFPAINYIIYRSTSLGKIELYIRLADTDTYNDTDVENGKRYYYRVCAENVVGAGHPTEELSAIPGVVPSTPENFFTFDEIDRIKLAWDPPAFNGGTKITGYRIYKGLDQSVIISTFDVGNIKIFIDTNVIKGIEYYYCISAVNLIGEGRLTEKSFIVIYSIPFAPQNLTARPGDSYINITWNPPENDGGYDITMFYINRNTTTGGFETLAKAHPDILFYNDTDVINGVTYTYTVQARNKLGKGEFSSDISAKAGRVIIPSSNKQPRAIIIADNSTGIAPLTVHFNGSGFDPDGTIVSYMWDFGDGNTSSEQNPVYTYEYPGTFYVTLRVFDNVGSAGLSMITISINKETVGPPDIPKVQKDEDKNSAWPVVALGVLAIAIVILILIFFVLPVIAKKSQPPEAVLERQKKNILINRISMIIKQPPEAEVVADPGTAEQDNALEPQTKGSDPEAEENNLVDSSDELEE